MYLVKQHKSEDSNLNPRELVIKIDGSALTTTTADAGVTLGLDSVQAKDDGSNAVTVTFRNALPNANYAVFMTPRTVNCEARVTSQAAGNFVYSTVQTADGSTAVADADVDILIKYHECSNLR